MHEWTNDKRFYYEPLLKPHPKEKNHSIDFLSRKMKFPLWVSSMTGGTAQSKAINENLAAACKEFGLGMGLGSCRILLEDSEKYLQDFAVRQIMGQDQPLFANLGIAQLEKISNKGNWESINKMINMLEADGLIIHVNPLQEWLQPEGDRFENSPIDIIKEVITNIDKPLIVKEVGQGMGPKSLQALLNLPVVVEFGAYGGTNFSQLEINRSENGKEEIYGELSNIGHNANEMIDYVNDILDNENHVMSTGFIISGGIKSFLDGYYVTNKIKANAVYGQASTLLKWAMKSEKELLYYIEGQISGYNLAEQFLTIRENK